MRSTSSLKKLSFLATFVLALSIGFFPQAVSAQGLTGQLSGEVRDASGAAVANADVEVKAVETGQVRSIKSDTQGHYVFTELLPGTFTLAIGAPGFKRYEQTGISITATERVTLPPVEMQVGALTDTISVTGESAVVQTESAERSGLINTRQMQELPLKGRSYLGTAKLIPGIIDTANRESPVGTIWSASILTVHAPVPSHSIWTALPVWIPAHSPDPIWRLASMPYPKSKCF